MEQKYNIPLSQITMLVIFNFGVQLLVDLLAVGFVDRIGYRLSMILALIWAILPILNTFSFAKVPLVSMIEDDDTGLGIKELFRNKTFRLLLVMMVCAGASEQAVSQWASTFAEKGLGISKTLGDLAGPMSFAILMGTSRLFYGKYGDKIKLDKFMICSTSLCILSYLGISLLPLPPLSLISCALCGLSVGKFWSELYSLSYY